MLWNSTAPNVVKQALQGGAISANSVRKADASKRLDFYHDVMLERLKAELAKRYAEPDKLLPYCINIVRKCIDILAMTYCQPPARTIEGSERDQDIWAEIVETAGLDAKLKAASRYTKLLKTILIRPVWRNGRMDIDLLTPNILDVEVGDSPEDLQAVLITHYGLNPHRNDQITYSLWHPDTFQRLNYRGQVIEDEPNPYGLLPFVPAWDRAPVEGGFWQTGGEDLATAQEGMNQLLTSLCYTLQQQGFGVGYLKGMEGQGTLSVGPGAMVKLPANGELGFAATKAPIEEFVEALDWLLKQTAVSNGLPASSLSTDPSDESGVSKLVDNYELQERRRDDVELWRRYEKALFDVTRTVWNVHNPGRKISENATLSIDFADPKPTTSEKEKAETWEKLLGLEVISPVDIVMQRNPDLSRDEALAYLLQVRDENAHLNERTI